MKNELIDQKKNIIQKSNEEVISEEFSQQSISDNNSNIKKQLLDILSKYQCKTDKLPVAPRKNNDKNKTKPLLMVIEFLDLLDIKFVKNKKDYICDIAQILRDKLDDIFNTQGNNIKVKKSELIIYILKKSNLSESYIEYNNAVHKYFYYNKISRNILYDFLLKIPTNVCIDEDDFFEDSKEINEKIGYKKLKTEKNSSGPSEETNREGLAQLNQFSVPLPKTLYAPLPNIFPQNPRFFDNIYPNNIQPASSIPQVFNSNENMLDKQPDTMLSPSAFIEQQPRAQHHAFTSSLNHGRNIHPSETNLMLQSESPNKMNNFMHLMSHQQNFNQLINQQSISNPSMNQFYSRQHAFSPFLFHPVSTLPVAGSGMNTPQNKINFMKEKPSQPTTPFVSMFTPTIPNFLGTPQSSFSDFLDTPHQHPDNFWLTCNLQSPQLNFNNEDKEDNNPQKRPMPGNS